MKMGLIDIEIMLRIGPVQRGEPDRESNVQVDGRTRGLGLVRPAHTRGDVQANDRGPEKAKREVQGPPRDAGRRVQQGEGEDTRARQQPRASVQGLVRSLEHAGQAHQLRVVDHGRDGQSARELESAAHQLVRVAQDRQVLRQVHGRHRQ